MAIEFNVNGYFDMSIFYLNTGMESREVSEEEEKEILSKLQSGDYLIGMESKLIIGINTMKPLYSFTISPTDAVEYDFDEI